MRLQVRSLALLSGLTIRCFRELWCRLQTWLGSHVAVALAQAGGPLAWEPPYATEAALKKAKRQKKKGILGHGFQGHSKGDVTHQPDCP